MKRIVLDIATSSVDEVRAFYADLLGLEIVMDLGWIATLSSGKMAEVQVSIATEGGSGAPVPDASIEVDDVDTVYHRAKELGLVNWVVPTDSLEAETRKLATRLANGPTVAYANAKQLFNATNHLSLSR